MLSVNESVLADIGIVTAIPREFDTINKLLNFKDRVIVPDAPLYEKGFFEGYKIIVTLSSDKGSIYSLLTTLDLIKNWDPRIIFLLGVAAGHGNDVNIGSVVFAKQIIGYEYSKIIDEKIINAPRVYESDEYLKNIALELRDTVHLGTVASGSKVVASEVFMSKLIEEIHTDICCLEMEGEGVAAACKHQKPPLPFIFLKGISDLGDSETKGKKNGDEELKDRDRQILAIEASVSAFKNILTLERFRITFPPKSQEIGKRARRKDWKASIPSPMSREQEFIKEIDTPSIKINGFDTHAQLFPRSHWNVPRGEYLFLDDPEHENRILLRLSNEPIADNLIDQLLIELKERIDQKDPNYEQYQNVYNKLTSEGSNPYPRLLGIPKIIAHRIGNISKMLLIDLAPSRYGIALIQEKGFDLPTAEYLKQTHILNSLAVRIALIHEDKFKIKYCEFHKRGEDNSTYKGAWDVGAAGYIDPQKHLDPENNKHISPWQAAAHELSEELNISRQMLPYRDKYYFFGLGRNIPTGQIDLLGYCHCPFTIPKDRECSKLVSEYECAKLNPESIVAFISSKKYWVPTAILTLVMTLETFGYTKERIYRAFSSLEGGVDFMP